MVTKQTMRGRDFDTRGAITYTFSGQVIETQPIIPVPTPPEPPITHKVIATINVIDVPGYRRIIHFDLDGETGEYIYDENLKSVKVNDIEISVEQLVNAGGNYLFDSAGEHTISYEFDDVSDGTRLFWDVDIETIILPENITSFSPAFFNEYSVNYLTSMTILATTPPTLGEESLRGSYPIFVPDASVDAYKTAWTQYASRIKPLSQKFFVKLTVQDHNGETLVGEPTEVELEGSGKLMQSMIMPYLDYTTDPDTGDSSGICITSMIIGELCTSIGGLYDDMGEAVESDKDLNTIARTGYMLQTIVLLSSITSIDNNAFAYCSQDLSITINATTPPALGNNTFGNYPYIYVPSESVQAYKTAWPNYANRIQAIS